MCRNKMFTITWEILPSLLSFSDNLSIISRHLSFKARSYLAELRHHCSRDSVVRDSVNLAIFLQHFLLIHTNFTLDNFHYNLLHPGDIAISLNESSDAIGSDSGVFPRSSR